MVKILAGKFTTNLGSFSYFVIIQQYFLFVLTTQGIENPKKKEIGEMMKQAGAELCQAQTSLS